MSKSTIKKLYQAFVIALYTVFGITYYFFRDYLNMINTKILAIFLWVIFVIGLILFTEVESESDE